MESRVLKHGLEAKAGEREEKKVFLDRRKRGGEQIASQVPGKKRRLLAAGPELDRRLSQVRLNGRMGLGGQEKRRIGGELVVHSLGGLSVSGRRAVAGARERWRRKATVERELCTYRGGSGTSSAQLRSAVPSLVEEAKQGSSFWGVTFSISRKPIAILFLSSFSSTLLFFAAGVGKLVFPYCRLRPIRSLLLRAGLPH